MPTHEKGSLRIVIICIYIDDCAIVGDTQAVNETILQLKNSKFNVKEMGRMSKYISCQFIKQEGGSGIKVIQADLINKMSTIFKDDILQLKSRQTPMGPGIKITHTDDPNDLLSDTLQKKFRLGVGMLLFLVKHSRPDLSNAIRELSKVMDKDTHLNIKQLLPPIQNDDPI